MKVEIDLTRCAGYGNCVDVAPETFQMSDVEDIAIVLLPEPGPELEESVHRAVRVCPANAIIVKDA